MLNGLRGRICVQADGGLRTGRDVAIAAMLGADEFGFATAPLIAAGCIMMRKCHLNTCPVGIATQDPVLRARFTGTPEHVINYFFFVAEELREIMASLGVRTLDEMIGRTDLLEPRPAVEHWKAQGVDLCRLLHAPEGSARRRGCNSERQSHASTVFDRELIAASEPALERPLPVRIERDVRNVDRSVGAMLSGEVARRHGHDGLPEGQLCVRADRHGRAELRRLPRARRHAGADRRRQRLCRQGPVGRPADRPPARGAPRDAAANIIVGNTCLYGAIAGEAFFHGVAGERFAVRNSGAVAVVEGTGDHGCEYMTGGRGRRARPGRAQLRRRHVGRHRLCLRSRRQARTAMQSLIGRSRIRRRGLLG